MFTALDLARVSGVAWGDAFSRPNFETWVLGAVHTPLGARGVELMARLTRHLDSVKPDCVFIEAPIRMTGALRKGSSAETILQLNGLVFVAQTVCHSRRVPMKLHERQKVLKHFTGRPTYPSGEGKRACQQRIRQIWGVDVPEDEADAGALLHYGCALEDGNAFVKARLTEPAMTR